MRIADVLFFAPGIKFSDLDFEHSELIIEAFQRRVEGFYLAPACHLIDKNEAFACGLICSATIDLIARYSLPKVKKVGCRICIWLRNNIPDFNRAETGYAALAERFYEDFRNGLVHEGRIKNLGQFSFDYSTLITFVDGAMIINPKFLLKSINCAFNKIYQTLKTDKKQSKIFISQLKEDFKEEIAATR